MEVKERKREWEEAGETEWRKSEFNRAKGHINLLSMGQEVRGKDLKLLETVRNSAEFLQMNIAPTLTSPV